MMLHKNKTSGKLRGIVATILAVAALAGIVTIQSCEIKQANETIVADDETAKKQDTVFTYVHKMPEADYDIYGSLGKVFIYPAEAKEKGIEGRVVVKFVVDKTGKIRDIHLSGEKNDPILGDAVLKAVAQLPDWIPGEDEQGNKVSVYYTLPVTFKLEVDEDEFEVIDEEPKKTSLKSSIREITKDEYNALTNHLKEMSPVVKLNEYELLKHEFEKYVEGIEQSPATVTGENGFSSIISKEEGDKLIGKVQEMGEAHKKMHIGGM